MRREEKRQIGRDEKNVENFRKKFSGCGYKIREDTQDYKSRSEESEEVLDTVFTRKGGSDKMDIYPWHDRLYSFAACVPGKKLRERKEVLWQQMKY